MDPKTHTKQSKTVSYEQFLTDVSELFEQAASGKRVTITRNGRLFHLAPMGDGRRHKRVRRLSEQDPLWEMVGITPSSEPGNEVASYKHYYLAKAIVAHKGRSVSAPTPSAPDTASEQG
jgi:hypothetical protein